MDKPWKSPLGDYLLSLADDELILGHRDSEWCGQAPILEEDIAFANLALDEIGHAHVWYTLLAGLRGEDGDAYPDRLVFIRPVAEFRCAQMLELPNGDWASSTLRQYLFDAYELLNLEALTNSAYRPLAEAAGKISTEELYHHRHSHAWVKRLALGTEESHRRMQAALDGLWLYTGQLFHHTPHEELLTSLGYLPSASELHARWLRQIGGFLADCELAVPADMPAAPPRSQHTQHLKVLVREMQSVTRMEPEAGW